MLLVLLIVWVSAKVKKKILRICRYENKTKSMIVENCWSEKSLGGESNMP